jgi:hypothetical protein
MALAGLVVLTLGAGLSACSSSGDGKAKKPTVTTPPPTAAPSLTGMNVDLVITGASPATVQGSKGACAFSSTGLANNYVVSGADYPQLGALGSIRFWGPTVIPNSSPVPPTIKLYINTIGFISSSAASSRGGLTVSADGRRIDVDTDLYGAPGGSFAGSLVDPTWTLLNHIKGSITCT